jgi:hypothetical protein
MKTIETPMKTSKAELQQIKMDSEQTRLDGLKSDLADKIDRRLRQAAEDEKSELVVWSGLPSSYKIDPSKLPSWLSWLDWTPYTFTIVDPVGRYAISLCRERGLEVRSEVQRLGTTVEKCVVIASWKD